MLSFSEVFLCASLRQFPFPSATRVTHAPPLNSKPSLQTVAIHEQLYPGLNITCPIRIFVLEQKSPILVLSVIERSLFGLLPFSSNPGQKPSILTSSAICASVNIFCIKSLHCVKPSYLYVLNPALRQTLNKLSIDILPVS